MAQMTPDDINKIVWRACDTFRGTIDPAQYKDYVLVLLIRRSNIASGTTGILNLNGDELGNFTLTNPFDAALVDDARVFHGVTAVQAMDAAQPAYRDVLVVTFRRS